MKQLYSLPLLAGLLCALLMTGCTAELAGSSSNSDPSGNPPPANGDNPGGTPASDPAPTVSLSANPTSVSSGGSSTLTWSSTNATSCAAGGGWSGDKATSGSESLSNITSTAAYTLTCTGTGGSANQSVTIAVPGTLSVTLDWDGVSLNADNLTPLTDLAGYRVYVAQSPGAYTPGNYTRQLGANSTGGTITTTIGNLAAGTYYFVVTAFDTSNNESGFSNEVVVTLP